MELKEFINKNGIELRRNSRVYSSMKRGIRINQIGYPVNAAKIAVIENPPSEDFEVMTIDESVSWRSIMRGKLEKKEMGFTADFSSISIPGDYMLICEDGPSSGKAGRLASHSFVIMDAPYRHAARLITEFFIWQRCGSLRGWAGLCHMEPSSLYGTGKRIDTGGGYHQSCDLRCWNDGVSAALYAYLRHAEISDSPWEPGLFEEEIRHACDYFMKLFSPEGFIYDSQFIPLGWGPRDYYNAPTSLGAHCNIAALLAGSAHFFAKKDAGYSHLCKQAAARIHDFIQDSSAFDKPYVCTVRDLPPGTQGTPEWYYQNYRTSATGISGCLRIALELDRAAEADTLLQKLLALQDPETGFFREHPDNPAAAYSDCSYTYLVNGPLVLADYLVKNPENAIAAAALGKYIDAMLAMFELSGFDTVPRYYHEFGGAKNIISFGASSSQMLHYSVLFSMGAELLARKDCGIAAQRAFDWICGANAEEASFITGVGYNHKRNPVFGQFFPCTPQIPGGIQHAMEGEYDLPAAGLALWASSLLR